MAPGCEAWDLGTSGILGLLRAYSYQFSRSLSVLMLMCTALGLGAQVNRACVCVCFEGESDFPGLQGHTRRVEAQHLLGAAGPTQDAHSPNNSTFLINTKFCSCPLSTD